MSKAAVAPHPALRATLSPPAGRGQGEGILLLGILGAVIFVLGLYYLQAARQEVTPFFRWTTWGRPLLLLVFILLVALKLIPPIVIVFGVIDLAGALWTAAALRYGT